MGSTSVAELERLSSLIDFIYRGATEPALWPDIIAGASDWLGSPKGMLYTPLHGPEQGGFYFQHGLSDFFLELYKARYQSVDMWTEQVVRRDLFKEGNVILGTDLVPHTTLVNSQWFRDCLQVGGISRLLSSVVFEVQATGADTQVSDMPTACSFYRGEGEAAYAEEDRRKLALLLPHFSRSLGVMTRLRLSDLKMASSLAALDQLPIAVLLLSGAGDGLFSNRAANSMLAGTDALKFERSTSGHGLGKLVAKLPSVNRQIARALSTARGIDDVLHFSSVIKVPGRVLGQDLLIQLSRVSLDSAFSADGHLPEVIAFLSDPKRPLDVAPEFLCDTYGLTMAEARTAVAATATGSLEALAAKLCVSINTVKTHLRQVYAKTGMNGRADLIRLVLGLASARSTNHDHRRE
ncbi:MAG: hypothetical protein Q8M01_10850 [Rubrivivax sp.]|nr:hypothetical protein [Rubrivivax sp.]